MSRKNEIKSTILAGRCAPPPTPMLSTRRLPRVARSWDVIDDDPATYLGGDELREARSVARENARERY